MRLGLGVAAQTIAAVYGIWPLSEDVSAIYSRSTLQIGKKLELTLRHATTPFISSRNLASIARISSAITSGLRGGL